ncbi:protein of unknown function [Cupriavidus taiwanensis]|nr:protein of unknown function [Cupriavidus taiwanensis]
MEQARIPGHRDAQEGWGWRNRRGCSEGPRRRAAPVQELEIGRGWMGRHQRGNCWCYVRHGLLLLGCRWIPVPQLSLTPTPEALAWFRQNPSPAR